MEEFIMKKQFSKKYWLVAYALQCFFLHSPLYRLLPAETSGTAEAGITGGANALNGLTPINGLQN